jgi:glycosyltransferase involved in cell wall biosynthesis
VKITVILCTFNRSESLARALESVAVSRLPDSVDWEVLVVDNNSQDQTRDVTENFCREYPGRFRYLFEAKPGKSNALNTAIREAQGDVLSFMDDDVIVEATWLQSLTASLRNGNWSGAGGRIIPRWNCSPPSWLPHRDRYALAPLAMFDPGTEAGALNEPPFGTNMAFLRKMFEEYGGFRTDLGPRPGSEIRNEDTEFGQRLLNAGEQLRYEPSAVVYHSVTPNRLTKKYFQTWWFDKARADFREFGVPRQTNWFVLGIPLCFFRRLAVWTLRWMVTLDPSLRFERKLKVWGRLGEIAESYRQSRERRAEELKGRSAQKVNS